MLTLTTADFRGVGGGLLRDTIALSGLVVAAAGAAGLTTVETPIIRALPRDGLVILQLLSAGHVAVHTFPDAGTLTLDLLLPDGRPSTGAVDVFTRRLQAASVKVTPPQARG